MKTNVVWITDNTDTVTGIQGLYNKILELEHDPDFPWILLNISCPGSLNTHCSDAVLDILTSCSKPIKTQVVSHAESFGVIFACVGTERVAWPKAQFMHHSIHLEYGTGASVEQIKKDIKDYGAEEKKYQDFMKAQMGEVGIKKLMRAFKKNSYNDYVFDSEKAVEYGLVHRIGKIDPIIKR